MTINLATYFDSRYLDKGISLIESIRRHIKDYRVFILALDDRTFEVMADRGDPRVEAFPLRAIESVRLHQLRRQRSWREYIFTLTPTWCRWVMKKNDLQSVSYVDADVFFLGPATALYDEVAPWSIGIIPHRWPPAEMTRLQAAGFYNVGWLYFRSTEMGKACLNRWEADCQSWVGQPGKFSDQVYLDRWPELYGASLKVIQNLGANLAPWNVARFSYREVDGNLFVSGRSLSTFDAVSRPTVDRLIFYHFHELRYLGSGKFYRTGYAIPQPIVRFAYEPYEKQLIAVRRQLGYHD